MIQKALGLAALALVVQFGADAHAAKTTAAIVTTLKIPVMIEKADGKTVPVSALNKELKKARTPELDEYLVISSDDKDVPQTISTFRDKVDASIQLIGKTWTDASFAGALAPTGLDDADHVTCYTGDPLAVSDVVNSAADSYFSDQLSQFGMKYKKITKFYTQDEVETNKLLEEGSELWKNWKGDDESVLILSSVGDGGDDVQESLIELCK